MTDLEVITPEVRAMVGRQSKPNTSPDEVCKSEIRRFAQSTMDDNPLWYDEQYARSTRFGPGCVSGPYALRAVGFYKRPLGAPERIGKDVDEDDRGDLDEESAVHIPWPAGVASFHGGDEVEFFQLPRIGDTITMTSKIVGVVEKTGRSGKLGIANMDRVYTNQRGEILAINHHFNIAREMQGDAWKK